MSPEYRDPSLLVPRPLFSSGKRHGLQTWLICPNSGCLVFSEQLGINAPLIHTKATCHFTLDGGCKYHTGTLRYGGWKATYTCCNASAGDNVQARILPGCTKGKHRRQHHLDYPYSYYYFHMTDLVCMF